MTLPFIVDPELDLSQFTEIVPSFPNWERSFISGTNSYLFQMKHFVHFTRKSLFLTEVCFLNMAEGPPGHVHGGASAALIDEVMGISVWHQGDFCVTQKLELHYGRLLPLQQSAWVYTEIVSDNTKTLEVHATIYTNTATGKSKKEKIPHVSALGIFHRLNAEQIARFQTSNT